MKSARVLLLVYCAFLILLIGCGGNSNSTNQTSNPGTPGTPPSTGGNGGGSGGGSGGGGTGGGSSPTGFLYIIENPNAASSVEAFSISNTGALTHISSSNASFN